MEFIKNLEEARLTRNSDNLKSLTYTDCCERAFLILLILEIMKNYSGYRSMATRYANKTLEKSDYSQFRAFNTDLYNFVHFIIGDESALEKLKDPKSAKLMRDKVTLPVFLLNRYLRSLDNSGIVQNTAQFFIKIETALKITNSDYKAIRRNVVNYNSLSVRDKKTTVTKLLYSARAKLRSSDIIDDFSKLVADRNLESEKVKDTEQQISVPDLVPTAQKLAYYRLLVGSENIIKLKKFLEFAKNDSAIPANFVEGYIPIIKIVDDIITGGPMYVRLLQQIHKNAKKKAN